MARNGPRRHSEIYDPKFRSFGSAFKPVLSSRNRRAAYWLMNDLLLSRSRFSTPPNVSHIAQLESFVENFFNEECPPDDLKTLSSRQSRNPSAGLALPQSKSKHPRKKMVFSELQSAALERNFKFKQYLSPPSRKWLANLLGLSKQQVITWFQNRRAKERKRAGVKLPRHGKKCIVGNFGGEQSRECRILSYTVQCGSSHVSL